jgi:hypothetical protein
MNINGLSKDAPQAPSKPEVIIISPVDIKDNTSYMEGGMIRGRVTHSCAWCGRSYYAWTFAFGTVVCSPKCKYEMQTVAS